MCILAHPHTNRCSPQVFVDETCRIQSRCTLIVTPTSIIHQWEQEIRRYAPSMSVCVFEGTKMGSKSATTVPALSLLQLALSDVVLVTYATLQSEIRYINDAVAHNEAATAASSRSRRHERRFPPPTTNLLLVECVPPRCAVFPASWLLTTHTPTHTHTCRFTFGELCWMKLRWWTRQLASSHAWQHTSVHSIDGVSLARLWEEEASMTCEASFSSCATTRKGSGCTKLLQPQAETDMRVCCCCDQVPESMVLEACCAGVGTGGWHASHPGLAATLVLAPNEGTRASRAHPPQVHHHECLGQALSD